MTDLRTDWLTDGHIDFEYKKYLLLAYLQQVEREFDGKKLYPKFSELIEHYRHLEVFKQQKKIMADSFPKEMTRLDLEQFKIQYRSLIEDDELIRELDEIVDFAMPQIKGKMSLGKELYEEVEHQVEVIPIGILPLRTDEGYLLLSDYTRRLVNVYYYHITIFENAMERLRGIHTQIIRHYDMSITNTYEHIKYQLIKEKRDMPAPATYALEFRQSFPLIETMLPVAKRVLVRYISL